MDPRDWMKATYNTVLFIPKRMYKAVRTTRNMGTK